MMCATLQAEEIMDDNMYLTEHHVHALANLHGRDILVFQDRKKKDALGSKVDIVHYQPGFKPQMRIGRQTASQLMKSDAPPVPIHLNVSVTHFSGLVAAEIDMAGRSMRASTKRKHEVISLM
jgi:hypothetical protein